MTMAAGVFIAVLISVIVLFKWLFQSTRVKTLINKIPGPPTVPLLGNALLFKPDGSDFNQQVLDFCAVYKNLGIFRMWVGTTPTIGVYKAETVEVLLNSSKHMSKSNLYRFLHPWLRTGLLTSTDEKWRFRRKLLTPSFHFRILTDFLVVFNEQSRIMVDKLKKEQCEKGMFDIFPYVTRSALDIICETAMGTNVSAQTNKDSDYVTAIYEICEIIQKRQKAPWLWPDIIFNNISLGKQHNAYIKTLHDFTETVIKERAAEFEEQSKEEAKKGQVEAKGDDELPAAIGKRKRLAFLDMLLYANKEGAGMDYLDIREEVDTFMFEGHDTTAAAANWAIHLVGANPKVLQKVQDEMDEIFGRSDRSVTMEDIKNMKYLECVVKEALRLFPSVPMFGRTISEDCVIGGYDVPKGTQAIILTNGLHRDPDYFPDPEKFDPDRWSLENSTKRHPYCYIPFSAGLRNCIGQKFAMNEEKVLLSFILRNFNIESCQTRDELNPVGEIIQRPSEGIKVKLTLRQHHNES